MIHKIFTSDRKRPAALLVVLLISITAAAQSGSELIEREKYFYDQLQAKNLAVLPEIFAEDFNGVFGGGILTKADEVEGFKGAVLEEYSFSDIRVRFPSKDTGIIVYKAFIKGSYKGKDITGESYHTSVYVKRGGKWLMTLHSEAAAAGETNMNKNFIGLATAVYIVPDIAKAKDWYSKAFGTEPYFDEPFYVGFNISGYELGLMPPDGDRVAGNSQVTYWAVPDCEAAFKKFIELGATEHEKPSDVGSGIVTAAVKDPWDNIIGLIRNPHFKK